MILQNNLDFFVLIQAEWLRTDKGTVSKNVYAVGAWSKKRRYIPFEERAIVPNTHEAIIPQDRWENVQRILYMIMTCWMFMIWIF